MPVGTRIKVNVIRTAGGFGGIESVEFGQFTHDVGFTTTRSVARNDISNTGADVYTVTTFWSSTDAASVPTFTDGVTSPAAQPATLISSDAITQINAAFPGTFA